MAIIDFHNHITAPDHPYHLPPAEYLAAMDAAGVDQLVILGKDYGALGGNLSDRQVADFVAASPERFIGFTAVHPDRPVAENVARIERAVAAYGLRGIKLNPGAGFYPNDRRLYPVYELAAARHLPVVFHAGIKPPGDGTRLKYCQPLHLDDVVVDFPDLLVVIAHAGYPWIDETIMVGLYAETVHVDISTLNQVEDALGAAVVLPTLERLYRALGSSRIVFGSDGIFNIDALLAAVRDAPFLSDADRERILGGNAARLLSRAAAGTPA